jgi:hypothetical protein
MSQAGAALRKIKGSYIATIIIERSELESRPLAREGRGERAWTTRIN